MKVVCFRLLDINCLLSMLSPDATSIIGFWTGIVGVLLSVVGILVSIVLTRRSERIKKIIYFVTSPIPIATTLPENAGYKISLLIERQDTPPLTVREAYLLFVKLGSTGKDPIRKEDLVNTDVLRVQVENASVLDISVIKKTQPHLGLADASSSSSGKILSFPLRFDFLDYKDGMVVRILTDSPHAHVNVTGKVVGMPSGAKLVSTDEDRIWNKSLSMGVVLVISSASWFFTFFKFAPRFILPAEEQKWWQSILVMLLIFGPPMLISFIAGKFMLKEDETWNPDLRLPYLPRPQLADDI